MAWRLGGFLNSLSRAQLALLTLSVQNTFLVIVMKFSRIEKDKEEDKYISSTAVFFAEIFKLIFSYILHLIDYRGKGVNYYEATKLCLNSSSWQTAIPAIIYTLQNSLQYVAVSNLDVTTFQVSYQLKILTTAFFTIFILRRTITQRQWIALCILTLGVASLYLPNPFQAPDPSQVAIAELSNDSKNRFVGLVSVLVACFLSGLAGVYFEKILKGSPRTVWERNTELALFSIITAGVFGVWLKDGKVISEKGILHGYTLTTWLTILVQASGGPIVAVVIKYADNVLKGFATSISIILSAILSVFLFPQDTFTISIVIGSSLVIYSTYLYSKKDSKPDTDEGRETLYTAVDLENDEDDQIPLGTKNSSNGNQVS
ncbi:nucleotide-sugar transporter [Conidiobolus coronatus NRRL 28638]|uniref:Nucleotide-sugar transporter n=1 Tax=Conidiobolus coronatus (strain ATCC 28846 / CBS 209.66 / NRRL 28638) TaxID=796925 RepID=A0A137PA69_CONC2|nr:nucleotide-sugar transporter [Conidiobolus coronatus NRRL 28638]|eukprot:KXN71903.1 nucleotide-sugar transporter [Conidiobolus coronatus NRRL 28638]